MAQFKITESRLRTIKKRQWIDRWGSSYIAAIWAVPQEAPGISTPSILRPLKLGQREFHTLSAAETFIALLCLHHPLVWEIHEQRIMYPMPRAHFLYGHPRASGLSFAPFLGTIEIADQLGMTHPKVRLRTGSKPVDWPIAPFPYFSDLVLFLEDSDGPFALNVPVKNKFADFRRKGPKKKPALRADADDPSTIARQKLEECYYSSARVRTQPIARSDLPNDLCWNLRELFLDDAYPVKATGAQREDIVETLRNAIGMDLPANLVARKIAVQSKVEAREVTAILRQSIWRRELRVDLFRTILMDKPLHPEVLDVFVHFADWFRR